MEGGQRRPQILEATGAVERGRRLLVLVDSDLVAADGHQGGVGEAGVQVVVADVVGQGQEAVLDQGLGGGQLAAAGGQLPAPAPQPRGRVADCHGQGDQGGDQRPGVPPPLVGSAGGQNRPPATAARATATNTPTSPTGINKS